METKVWINWLKGFKWRTNYGIDANGLGGKPTLFLLTHVFNAMSLLLGPDVTTLPTGLTADQISFFQLIYCYFLSSEPIQLSAICANIPAIVPIVAISALTPQSSPQPLRYTLEDVKIGTNAYLLLIFAIDLSDTGEKPYVCKFENCDKRFTVLGTLLIHERTHTGLKPFQYDLRLVFDFNLSIDSCPVDECSYAANDRSKLSAHMKKNHGLSGCQTISNGNTIKSHQLIPINLFDTLSTTPENIQSLYSHYFNDHFIECLTNFS